MAKKLAGMFVNNFKEYEAETENEIAAAGPKI
jgi:ATP-dependent phosphoenolpyruvate carboxykinase